MKTVFPFKFFRPARSPLLLLAIAGSLASCSTDENNLSPASASYAVTPAVMSESLVTSNATTLSQVLSNTIPSEKPLKRFVPDKVTQINGSPNGAELVSIIANRLNVSLTPIGLLNSVHEKKAATDVDSRPFKVAVKEMQTLRDDGAFVETPTHYALIAPAKGIEDARFNLVVSLQIAKTSIPPEYVLATPEKTFRNILRNPNKLSSLLQTTEFVVYEALVPYSDASFSDAVIKISQGLPPTIRITGVYLTDDDFEDFCILRMKSAETIETFLYSLFFLDESFLRHNQRKLVRDVLPELAAKLNWAIEQGLRTYQDTVIFDASFEALLNLFWPFMSDPSVRPTMEILLADESFFLRTEIAPGYLFTPSDAIIDLACELSTESPTKIRKHVKSFLDLGMGARDPDLINWMDNLPPADDLRPYRDGFVKMTSPKFGTYCRIRGYVALAKIDADLLVNSEVMASQWENETDLTLIGILEQNANRIHLRELPMELLNKLIQARNQKVVKTILVALLEKKMNGQAVEDSLRTMILQIEHKPRAVMVLESIAEAGISASKNSEETKQALFAIRLIEQIGLIDLKNDKSDEDIKARVCIELEKIEMNAVEDQIKARVREAKKTVLAQNEKPE